MNAFRKGGVFAPFLTKTMRVMQFSAILILGACLHAAAAGHSQTITFSGNDVPLEQMVKVIKQQTGFETVYDQSIGGQQIKSVHAYQLSLDEFLKAAFRPLQLDFVIESKTVFLRAKKPTVDLQSKAHYLLLSPPITGVVRGPDGQTLAGVNVVVKGTKRGVSTDAYGNFNIEANSGDVLVVSSIGYGAREIKLNGQKNILVELELSLSPLDEVQVIPYGTTTKRLNTGNTATVKGSEIERQPVNNPLLALQGRVPGLTVTQSTGVPGGGVTVRIQGQNSLTSGSEPLYVVDGVPFTQQLMQNLAGNFGILGTSGGSPLSFINPSDIESIEVLKDADATSIYGSRAAAGAILITTKKGKQGKTRIDLNAQTGWGKVSNFLPLLNTEQYVEMRKEAIENDGLTVPNISTTPNDVNYDVNGFWSQSKYTDWQKVFLGGTAKYHDVQLSTSGGNANTTFLISSGYHKETTVFPSDLSDQKGSLHIALNNVSTNQKFRTQFSGSYLVDNNNLINTDLTKQARRLSPNAPDLYNSDGTLNWARLPNGNSTWFNPLAYLDRKYNVKSKNLMANTLIGYEILKGLNIQSSFGYNNLQTDEYVTIPLSSIAPELRSSNNGLAQFANGSITTWIIEPQATYRGNVLNGTVEVLVGTTISREGRNNQRLTGSNYSSDLLLTDIRSAGSILAEGTVASVYRYNAIFGRANYNYQNKYILNLTGRRDGSSRFGSENLFNNFWSVAGAWIFSNEAFLHKSRLLSFGKIRASYGTSGNDQIGDYQFLNLYNSIAVAQPYGGATGLQPAGFPPNPYLQWEETKKIQFGVDLGFLHDRIILNTNYYLNRSSNQLQLYSLPLSTGRGSIQRNFPAIIQNSGWEVTLNSTNIQTKAFTWKTSLNLTVPQNKLVSYPELETSAFATSYVVGQPFTITKLYHFLNVDPTTGLYLFEDQKGMPLSSDLTDSAKHVFNTSPKFYGGFTNTIHFKGFELDILFQFVKQVIRNYSFGERPGQFFSSSSGLIGINNQPDWVMGRWQKPGDDAAIQKFSSTYPLAVRTPYTNAALTSDAAFSDGSYIRLKNISLSWQIPENWKRKIRMQDARVYVQGQNLLTITDYKGIDPENGFDVLPPLRVVTVGIKIGL